MNNIFCYLGQWYSFVFDILSMKLLFIRIETIFLSTRRSLTFFCPKIRILCSQNIMRQTIIGIVKMDKLNLHNQYIKRHKIWLKHAMSWWIAYTTFSSIVLQFLAWLTVNTSSLDIFLPILYCEISKKYSYCFAVIWRRQIYNTEKSRLMTK